MDNFFIANKLRGIPLVSGRSEWAKKEASREEAEGKRSAVGQEIQLEKRDVASSSSLSSSSAAAAAANEGILFKSAAITASTSNLRKNSSTKPTTARWIASTSTTRRPPTSTRIPAARRKLVKPDISSTTRRPMTRYMKSSNGGDKQSSRTLQVSSPPAAITSTTEPSVAAQLNGSSSPTTTGGANRFDPNSRTTLRKFDKLIQYHEQQEQQQQQQQTASEINLPATARTSTTAHLPISTQPLNQRRTQQPVLGPQKFNDGRSLSAGPNWVVFSQPDGSYSLFEVLVLLSSIIMVSTIVIVIINNWVRAFKRKRQRRLAKEEPAGGDGSRSASMNLPASEPTGDGSRKISMISSGINSLATITSANTISEQTLSSSSGKPQELAAPSAPSAVAGAANGPSVMVEAKSKMIESAQQQVIGASQLISSEFKQVAGNISNKAMAIVQPTENSTNIKTSSKPADSISVMSEPMADKTPGSGSSLAKLSDKMVSGPEKSINRSVSDLSGGQGGLKPLTAKSDQAKSHQEQSALLDTLFNSTHSTSAAKGAKKAPEVEKKTELSRVGSLDSIELPPTLVESIKRTEMGKAPAADIAPSPNLLLGEVRAPAEKNNIGDAKRTDAKDSNPASGSAKSGSQKIAKKEDEPAASSSRPPAEPKKKATPPKVAPKTTDPAEEDQRPGNPMGRDELEGAAQVSRAAPAAEAAEVKNHQVVVNRLDKRKTNLEIVDLRDESVTGNMRSKEEAGGDASPAAGNWISMDGVAVVQAASGALPAAAPAPAPASASASTTSEQQAAALMSPSEIIESRFHVDYKSKRRAEMGEKSGSKDSADSKATDYATNNIESELEQDNRMRNRKYFVYIVHDGHFTAKKECIARIELPQKRRITLAEMRQLISNSQDISLTSLRRNRFKFVTETYRLLNENEDATILHQVYPTQGVFLKLNIPEQENQAYAFKGARTGQPQAGRLSTGSNAGASSLANTTIASRRRAGGNRQSDALPAIELDGHALDRYERNQASGSGRKSRQPTPGSSYRRTKSSVVEGRRQRQQQQRGHMTASHDRLPSIGRSTKAKLEADVTKQSSPSLETKGRPRQQQKAATLGEAASDLGQNVLSGAKKLFASTFKL